MTGEIVVLGECMGLFLAQPGTPLTVADSFRSSIAGAEANVAVGMSRLGHHARFLGRVGNDGLGDRVLRTLRAESIDVSGVVVDTDRTTGILTRDAVNDRPIEVVYHRTGSAGSALEPADIPDAALDEAAIFHTSGITAMLSDSSSAAVESAFQRSRSLNVTTSLDVNLRLRLNSLQAWAARIRPLLSYVDVLFVSEDELNVVSDDWSDIDHAFSQIHALGPDVVVVKRGAAGASASNGTNHRSVPARPVHVLDPVGAGDAFAAGFLSVLIDNTASRSTEQLDAALTAGTVAAAHVLGVPSDIGGLPTIADMSAALSSDRETRR